MTEKIKDKEMKKEFFDILNNKKIYPVYQPIVSLSDGSILGYEALTRINIKNSKLNICNMFELAEKYEMLWELESLCRNVP